MSGPTAVIRLTAEPAGGELAAVLAALMVVAARNRDREPADSVGYRHWRATRRRVLVPDPDSWITAR